MSIEKSSLASEVVIEFWILLSVEMPISIVLKYFLLLHDNLLVYNLFTQFECTDIQCVDVSYFCSY